MKRLGAIIAGGQSSRFGTDKAEALLNGRTLIEHVADGLRAQCDALIICGRAWGDWISLADWPSAGLGPLGGLSAALHYGALHGFSSVVTAGCDTLPVPVIADDGPLPVVIARHYLFGHWPVTLAGQLDAHLASNPDRSMRHWMAACGAREIATATPLFNINTQADFRHYVETQGLAA